MAKVAVFKLYDVGECLSEREALEKGKKAYIEDLRKAMTDERHSALFSFDIELVENVGKNKEDK